MVQTQQRMWHILLFYNWILLLVNVNHMFQDVEASSLFIDSRAFHRIVFVLHNGHGHDMNLDVVKEIPSSVAAVFEKIFVEFIKKAELRCIDKTKKNELL